MEVIDSDSETTKEPEALSTTVVLKKKKKASRTAQCKESAKDDQDNCITGLKERSSAAFNRMLNLVTGFKLESCLTQKILAIVSEMRKQVNESLIINSRLEGKKSENLSRRRNR